MIFTGPASRTIEAAAADGNLKVGDGYVDSNGFVRRRLS
jgi:hypothetical protein